MRTKVAIISGGYTEEAKISAESAAFVLAKLDAAKYEAYLIHISLDSWSYADASGRRHEVDKRDFSIGLDGGGRLRFDLAFIALHGSPGEDGRLQGYFDMIGLPYTSCGALTSALTMNKGYTKAVLADIPEMYTARSLLLFAGQRTEAARLVRENLQLPCFVKPNAGGSSIGMSKVTKPAELQAALDRAYDAQNTGTQVLVEEFVHGREFSQGIFRRADGELIVLPATEVKTGRDFFDYEAKYVPGLSEEITPADLTEEQRERASRIIREIYNRLDCKGMVRVDFFLERGTDRLFFIEINTVPGQTAQSFIPQQVRAAGMTETDFYGEIIEAAFLN